MLVLRARLLGLPSLAPTTVTLPPLRLLGLWLAWILEVGEPQIVRFLLDQLLHRPVMFPSPRFRHVAKTGVIGALGLLALDQGPVHEFIEGMALHHPGELLLHARYLPRLSWSFSVLLLHAAVVVLPAELIYEVFYPLDVPGHCLVLKVPIFKELRMQILPLRLDLFAVVWHLYLVAPETRVESLLEILLVLAERIEAAGTLIKRFRPVAFGGEHGQFVSERGHG